MNRITRRILHLVVWGCAFFVFAAAAWVGFCWLKRPPYLVPDTSAFATGDVFFSVGDAWESVAVRALSGCTSFEVCDSTPSHCGIVIRYADGVRLAHASTVAKKVVMETPEEYLRKNGSYCIYARKAPCAVDTARWRRWWSSRCRSTSTSTTPRRRRSTAPSSWCMCSSRTIVSASQNSAKETICILTMC